MNSPVTPPPVLAHVQLLHLLAEGPELQAFLDEAVQLAARHLSAATACGMTLSRDLRAFTIAHSDAFAAEIDEIQYGDDEGPCLQALRTGEVVEVTDMCVDRRWPAYGPHAAEHGLRSSLSHPLTVDGQTVAVLNLYARKPRAFEETDRQHTAGLAAQCSAALTVILRQADQALTQRQLADALNARSIIDQALGIVMIQQRCTAAEAFRLLSSASAGRNQKIRDIAADLITRATGHPPEPPAPFETVAPRSAADDRDRDRGRGLKDHGPADDG